MREDSVASAFDADALCKNVAALFALLGTPVRLRIIRALCSTEKNVSQLLAEIETTQPNMSQHLACLHRNGVLGRRRQGTQVYYRVQNEHVAALCQAVFAQLAAHAAAVRDASTRPP